jgi:ribonuclease Z
MLIEKTNSHDRCTTISKVLFLMICLSRSSAFSITTPSSSPTTLFSTTIVPPPSPTSSEDVTQALQYLASTTLALLSGNEDAASSLSDGAAQKKHVVSRVFQAYDDCGSGTLSTIEAQSLFVDLARSMVIELSKGANYDELIRDNNNNDGSIAEMKAAQAHARRVLADDEAGNTIDRVAKKLLLMADIDGDGRINLQELAQLFETIFEANLGVSQSEDIDDNDDDATTKYRVPSGKFPQPLRALAGSLQLLPPRERTDASEAANRSELWNMGVPGDDHTLRRVILEDGDDKYAISSDTKTTKQRKKQSNSLSLIGLGRSADASAYFIPELGIALDAGLHVSSLEPKTVLLTHGHRDHIGALPVHASRGALLLVPQSFKKLVHNFLIAEAQLNYGDANQTDEQTLEFSDFNLMGVVDGSRIMLPKDKYIGSPTPIGIKVLSAPHKQGVPSVSYGIFTQKQRLKEEYRRMSKSELGSLLRSKREVDGGDELSLTESYDEGLIFYTGDTQITLLRERWREICRKYKYIIHEVTFLGPPSSELDSAVAGKGHTHYAQLHPWILAFPNTIFICAHFSLRYDKNLILDFFDKNYGGVPKNIVLWL